VTANAGNKTVIKDQIGCKFFLDNPKTPSISDSAKPTRKHPKIKNQNSDLEARPLKTPYFLKHVLMAV
jgi:hypothetical protein